MFNLNRPPTAGHRYREWKTWWNDIYNKKKGPDERREADHDVTHRQPDDAPTQQQQALGVKLSLEMDDDLPDIDIDRDRVSQVMLNLYLNGLQAMEEAVNQKELKVTVHHDNTAGTVVIAVHDSGSGISRENIDKVFDPYFTTKPEGTGLGLALAYKIIDEHNGSIWFESVECEGTTVYVALPTR